MSDNKDEIAARIADALERIADSVASLEVLFVEREKKFEAKKFDRPRSGGFGGRGGDRGGFKKDFGDRGDRPFKKRFDDRDGDDRGDRPFKKRFANDDGGEDNFKKRGPKSTFRDFDAPKNFKGKGGAGRGKPGGFKGKKKF
ncbi:MAG: hypothetical protein AB7G06_06850 [Bdellovibrionales bacterium]